MCLPLKPAAESSAGTGQELEAGQSVGGMLCWIVNEGFQGHESLS